MEALFENDFTIFGVCCDNRFSKGDGKIVFENYFMFARICDENSLRKAGGKTAFKKLFTKIKIGFWRLLENHHFLH